MTTETSAYRSTGAPQPRGEATAPRPEGAPSRPSAGELLRPRPVALTLALLALVLAGGIAASLTRSAGTTYGSRVVLAIDQPQVVAAATDAGPVDKLSRLRTQYAALLRTAVVADDIARRAGVPAGSVPAKVSAQAVPTSLLIVITAEDDDRGRARALATASAEALADYAKRTQTQAAVPAGEQVVLDVVTPATSPQQLTQGRRTVATVALFLGLVAAVAVYVLVSLLQGRRRR